MGVRSKIKKYRTWFDTGIIQVPGTVPVPDIIPVQVRNCTGRPLLDTKERRLQGHFIYYWQSESAQKCPHPRRVWAFIAFSPGCIHFELFGHTPLWCARNTRKMQVRLLMDLDSADKNMYWAFFPLSGQGFGTLQVGVFSGPHWLVGQCLCPIS